MDKKFSSICYKHIRLTKKNFFFQFSFNHLSSIFKKVKIWRPITIDRIEKQGFNCYINKKSLKKQARNTICKNIIVAYR